MPSWWLLTLTAWFSWCVLDFSAVVTVFPLTINKDLGGGVPGWRIG